MSKPKVIYVRHADEEKVHLLYAIGAALDDARRPDCIVLCGAPGTWRQVDQPEKRSGICNTCYEEAYG